MSLQAESVDITSSAAQTLAARQGILRRQGWNYTSQPSPMQRYVLLLVKVHAVDCDDCEARCSPSGICPGNTMSFFSST